MSARTPRTFRFRRRLRRVALWLGLAAAFLPTFFPSLHPGHGFPIAPPPTVADAHLVHSSAVLHHAHHAAHALRVNDQDRRHGAPAAPDHRPVDGTCPICQTLQQIGAVVVAEVAHVVERDVADGEPVTPPVVRVSTATRHDSPQARAPPVDA